MPRLVVAFCCAVLTGCSMLPYRAHRATLFNPYPQLSKIAVAPFFNLSDDPTVDGREAALSYFNELQAVPGFEVVPVGVTEAAIQAHQLRMSGPEEARRLAQVLGVDAVVIGAITDFNMYYPPRCGLQVEWYAADPSFQPIPAGYGLPWGTHREKKIPEPLVFEARMAQARAALQGGMSTPAGTVLPASAVVVTADGAAPCPAPLPGEELQLPLAGPGAAPSSPVEPVLRHTRIYHGEDADFTAALKNYYEFRDDRRFGGWRSYLQRKDDFLQFCCRTHLWEMFSARGGAGKTQVVWRWPKSDNN